jgi:hypothetical protein
MSVPQRQLGRNGPMVSSVGLGLMSIGGAYGQKDNKIDKIALLDHAHAIGEHFWDTADVYVSSIPYHVAPGGMLDVIDVLQRAISGKPFM